MNKTIISAIALLMLAGCTISKPEIFERVDEDPAVNTVQYRYNPQRVNKAAMLADVSSWCADRGFDKVDLLPAQKSHIPGLEKIWYQCNYSIKN